MQLAMYTVALIRQEEARERLGIPHREVLPPAILCATTGRMIVMTEAEMQSSITELESLLSTLGELALEEDLEHECDCSMSLSNIRLFSRPDSESE